jgi:hypothetical protein
MAIGQSGRLVIEVDPEFKKELYANLERDRLTLRDWFLQRAREYISTGPQLPLRLFEKSDSEVTP